MIYDAIIIQKTSEVAALVKYFNYVPVNVFIEEKV